MSDNDATWRLLSPDEIAAIVDELASARREAERQRRPAGIDPEGGRGDRLAALRRNLERFGRDQARALASRFQRRIEVELLSLDEARADDLAAAMLPSDRVLVFARGRVCYELSGDEITKDRISEACYRSGAISPAATSQPTSPIAP